MGAREDAKGVRFNNLIGMKTELLHISWPDGFAVSPPVNEKKLTLPHWLSLIVERCEMEKEEEEEEEERSNNMNENRFDYGQDVVRGYKAFNKDWTCMNKQYACPGIFHEDGPLILCGNGMHFCEELSEVFSYYDYIPDKIHVCEVIAMGQVERSDDGRKCCCTDLVIVRELTPDEIVANANMHADNNGVNNTGHKNTGDWNVGNENEGHRNTGHKNTGHLNTGDHNLGSSNTGDDNHGCWNTGFYNTGDHNAGSRNTGCRNTGRFNTGSWNSGNYNTGDYNSGSFNVGNYHTGWFNTDEEPLYLFNKPAPNLSVEKRTVLQNFVSGITMSSPSQRQWWWDEWCTVCRDIVMLPNFDPDIFKACTGIDARKAVVEVATCTKITMKPTIADGVIATMRFPDGHEIEMIVDGYNLVDDRRDAYILGGEHKSVLVAAQKEISVWVN